MKISIPLTTKLWLLCCWRKSFLNRPKIINTQSKRKQKSTRRVLILFYTPFVFLKVDRRLFFYLYGVDPKRIILLIKNENDLFGEKQIAFGVDNLLSLIPFGASRIRIKFSFRNEIIFTEWRNYLWLKKSPLPIK